MFHNRRSLKTNLDQGHSVPIRTCQRNVDQRFSESWSLAFFGSTEGAVKSIIRAQVLVLCVDVLALLAVLVLTISAGQVNVVGVETGHIKKER